ncbi:GNAT family N-acetyltransferase [Chloroflexota bacterium]
MENSTEETIRLRKSLVKPAARMLARAFENDPVIAYAYGDAAKARAKTPYIYEFLLRFYLRYAEGYTTSERLEGVALWQFQGEARIKTSFWPMVLSGAIWPAMRMGSEAGKRMQPFFEYVEQKRRDLAPRPHWYLMVLGVDPASQGRGYAGWLLREKLARIDTQGLPSFLETEKEKNVSLYQHFGYEVVEEYVIPNSTVRLWAMLRPPAAPSARKP